MCYDNGKGPVGLRMVELLVTIILYSILWYVSSNQAIMFKLVVTVLYVCMLHDHFTGLIHYCSPCVCSVTVTLPKLMS